MISTDNDIDNQEVHVHNKPVGRPKGRKGKREVGFVDYMKDVITTPFKRGYGKQSTSREVQGLLELS